MAKIDKQMVNDLGQMIMTAVPRSQLLEGITKYQNAGMSFKRFLWDCLWAVPHQPRANWFAKAYGIGANDDHVFTALKSWFKSTGLEYK